MNVVILDTGCANLSSVKYAVQRLGYEPVVSRSPEIVLQADKLFLPGVGTAQAAMEQLEQRELIGLIKACTQPVLGICLGMQLLASSSEENGGIDTLGIIDTPCNACLISVCRCRIWAGIRSQPMPTAIYSAALMKMPTSISSTDLRCRYAKIRLPRHFTVSPSVLLYKR